MSIKQKTGQERTNRLPLKNVFIYLFINLYIKFRFNFIVSIKQKAGRERTNSVPHIFISFIVSIKQSAT